MSALTPGTVIDGRPEEVAEVLQGAPEGTVVAGLHDDVWRKSTLRWQGPGTWVQPSESMFFYCPLTVLRWGRELPPPVDVRVRLVAVAHEVGCRTLSQLGVVLDDKGRAEILEAAIEDVDAIWAAGGDPA